MIVSVVIYGEVYNNNQKPTVIQTDSKSWVGIVPTQCDNPWDDVLFETYQKWIDENNITTLEPYKDLQKEMKFEVIKEYYEKKGVTVFESKYNIAAVDPGICEACGCVGSGQAWYFLVSDFDLDFMSGYTIPKEKVSKYSSTQVTWIFQPVEISTEIEPKYYHYSDKNCVGITGVYIDEEDNYVRPIEKGFFQDQIKIDYSQCTLIIKNNAKAIQSDNFP